MGNISFDISRAPSLSRLSLSLSRIPAAAGPPSGRRCSTTKGAHHPSLFGGPCYVNHSRRSQPRPPKNAQNSRQPPRTAATVLASETGQDDLCLCIQYQGFVDLGKTNQTPQERASSEPPRAVTAPPKLACRWASAAATVFANREHFPITFGCATTWVVWRRVRRTSCKKIAADLRRTRPHAPPEGAARRCLRWPVALTSAVPCLGEQNCFF